MRTLWRDPQDPDLEFSLDTAPYGREPVLPEPVTGIPSSRPRRRAQHRPAPMPVPEFHVGLLGPIRVTNARVYTPLGAYPLNEVRWWIGDKIVYVEETPEWARLSGLAGIPFSLGLSMLFWLVKEVRVDGYVKIQVSHRDASYVTRVPVRSFAELHHLHWVVQWARQWGPKGSRRVIR
ncbi:hypothetical protein Afil01_08520 [Actinorhabdospora filicis]|uniref:Uncharacterized protein n=1 Tax=Actinorhabdospora filicis TaxID=1785913 RepID=A0A9W6SF60_9ACTN|nr:hypothetical protein [Actinorhabdospora filicis]GLZ76045.1 hypothetical protein Afil01_08520 [Actinorhabdospora filicis]